MTRPLVICMTPVKDEAWILRQFLEAAVCWADHVVVADQGSTDGSREIAASFGDRVHVVDNRQVEYDEGSRQRLLLDSARNIEQGAPRFLVALDADEALPADLPGSAEWEAALAAPPGTLVTSRWANVLPGGTEAWLSPTRMVFGLVDNGSPHRGEVIHSTRLPDPGMHLELAWNARVLHFQFVDWERMEAKQRWYQAWERVENPSKRPIQIWRQYHHMHAIPAEARRPLDASSLQGLAGLAAARDVQPYAHDLRVLTYFEEFGTAPFRRLDLWGPDWSDPARGAGSVADPRTAADRAVHRWLARTQATSDRRRIRYVQRALRVFGW